MYRLCNYILFIMLKLLLFKIYVVIILFSIGSLHFMSNVWAMHVRICWSWWYGELEGYWCCWDGEVNGPNAGTAAGEQCDNGFAFNNYWVFETTPPGIGGASCNTACATWWAPIWSLQSHGWDGSYYRVRRVTCLWFCD